MSRKDRRKQERQTKTIKMNDKLRFTMLTATVGAMGSGQLPNDLSLIPPDCFGVEPREGVFITVYSTKPLINVNQANELLNQAENIPLVDEGVEAIINTLELDDTLKVCPFILTSPLS